jgi:putative ABC transport system substrate-binding protein
MNASPILNNELARLREVGALAMRRALSVAAELDCGLLGMERRARLAVQGAKLHSHTRRRLLQGSLAWAGLSLLSGCEKGPKVHRIGFLGVGSREGRAFMIGGFLQGLREHGYVEGQNIVIEYRFSGDRNDRLPELAAELVQLKVELIVASGTPASFAAKQATSTIPIVMGGLAANPVETGLIASLAHPGGNVTGISMMTSQLGGKRLELLKEIMPGLARVAVFWNPPNPAYGPILKALEEAAPALGVTLQRLEVRTPGDFEGAFEAATKQRADALIAPPDPLVTNQPKMVADLALKYRLPAMMDNKEFVENGGLLSLGLDLVDSYRRAATHVDKILKGAKAGDLPMEQPTQFDLFVNLKTARAIGLTIPKSVLLQATEVIE